MTDIPNPPTPDAAPQNAGVPPVPTGQSAAHNPHPMPVNQDPPKTATTGGGTTLTALPGGAAAGNATGAGMNAAQTAAPPAPPTVLNSFGASVNLVLDSVKHPEDFVKGADYVGYEPVHCDFYQRTCFQVTERYDASLGQPAKVLETLAVEDGIVSLVRGEIFKKCLVAKPTASNPAAAVQADFLNGDFNRYVDGFSALNHRHALGRNVNTAWDLLEEFTGKFDPTDPACVQEWRRDARFLATWLQKDWKARADTPAERRRNISLSVRMLTSVVDRIREPGRLLKVWVSLCGETSLGKTALARDILPNSMKAANMHSTTIDLTKSRDHIVRELAGTALCEIEELANVNHTHVAALKRSLAMSFDLADEKYIRRRVGYQSTTAFIGTMNANEDIFPPKADNALLQRLPLVLIEDSPWGAEVPVREQLDANNEALKRRLWRGAVYWRFHARTRKGRGGASAAAAMAANGGKPKFVKGLDPALRVSDEEAELTKAIGERFVYKGSAVNEYAATARTVIAKHVHADTTNNNGAFTEFDPFVRETALQILGRGLMASEIVDMLRADKRAVPVGEGAAKSMGRYLAASDDWVVAQTLRSGVKVWVCISLCARFESHLAAGSVAESAWNEMKATRPSIVKTATAPLDELDALPAALPIPPVPVPAYMARSATTPGADTTEAAMPGLGALVDGGA